MRRTIALTALLVCCCGTSAAGDIEITAMYGYRWGGEIDADQSPLFTEDVEIDDGAAYGLALGFRPLGALIIELSALVWSPDLQLRAFLTVGVLGAFTTFSTFSLDVVVLYQRGELVLAAGYVLLSVVLSITALFAAMILVRHAVG